jgi:hypothetical protein
MSCSAQGQLCLSPTHVFIRQSFQPVVIYSLLLQMKTTYMIKRYTLRKDTVQLMNILDAL